MKEVISFLNVFKRFENKIVLNDLSFSIYEHDFVGLVGNNGCGKSTTINTICNLLPYNLGEIKVFGYKVTPSYISYKRKFGIVLSSHYFIEEFTPVEYLIFVAKFQDISKKEVDERIADIINVLNFGEHKNTLIRKLSSGNKMKVSLAAALIHNPEVLILDEPFVNLDIQTSQDVLQILTSLKNRKTVFITSHSLELIAGLCSRFLIMEKGRILAEVNKHDYTSLEDLKNQLTQYLVKQNDTVEDLLWLK